VEEYVRGPALGAPLPQAVLALAERESAVLKAMATGLPGAEIGQPLSPLASAAAHPAVSRAFSVGAEGPEGRNRPCAKPLTECERLATCVQNNSGD
jgi:hypothetical protein